MLVVEKLSCRRSARLVFRDVGFRLQPGGLLQVTGANGSGKSSLLRALAGLLPAAEGVINWQGNPIDDNSDAHRARLHYVGHLDALKPEFTATEMLVYWQALQPEAKTPADDVFGISAFAHKPIRYLSAGQKRRLTLSRLTMVEIPLWLLDEPTTALDTDGQKLLLACIEQHRAKGGMVVAAVHHELDLPDSEILELKNVDRAGEVPLPSLREGLGVGQKVDILRDDAKPETSCKIVGYTPTPSPSRKDGRGALTATACLRSIFNSELKLHIKHKSEWASLLLFFLIVILLLPFALGPEPELLKRLAPGLIWLAALLMSLLALDRLFIADARDGTLDLMVLSPLPLPLIVAAKLSAQSLTMLVALLIMIVPAALLLGLSANVLPVLAFSLVLGVPALVLLGGIAASITIALQRNPALLTVLLVPFYIPLLIFAMAACDAAAMDTSPASHLALLGAILAILMPTAPFVIAAALRQGQV